MNPEIRKAWERARKCLKEVKEQEKVKKELERQAFQNSEGDADHLDELLHVTRWLNNAAFSNMACVTLEDGSRKFHTTLTVGPTSCNLSFRVNSRPDGLETISHLKAACHDDYIQTELKAWQNQCVRKNSLHIYFKGLQHYGKLFTQRDEVFDYLQEVAPQYFLTAKYVDDGHCIVSATELNTRIEYFMCEWTIIWNPITFTMEHFFNLRANNEVPFFHKNRILFNELINSTKDGNSDKIGDMWKMLARNVIEENKKQTLSF